jgi:glycosidase/fibronectin type 3 domain-containing protein
MRTMVSSRRLVTTLAGLLAVCLSGSTGALGATPAPSPSGVGSSGTGERAPLAVDGTIRESDLQHDSRDDTYRSPGGAVPAGTPVLLRLRAGAGDLSGVDLRLTDRATGASRAVPMERMATDPDAGDHGFDFWQATIPTDEPAVLDYWFAIRDGAAVRYLSDDPALDGGTGRLSREAPTDGGWQLTAYDPAFSTPDWARGAVVYQIFPDRFANGDPANDPSPDATPDPDGAGRYRFGDVYGNPILPKAWDELPEGYCRAYQGVPCDEAALGRDFFGGDLKGITAGLDGLADLGVTAIYLNPVFAAPSNHRYDTTDYRVIDPDLGTLEDFQALVEAARELGIRVILDGVFNHVSSDSPWFDREGRYPETGACESAGAATRDWFVFRAPGPGQPAPCAPSTPGGSDTYYQGWFGFDTIPEVNEVPDFLDLIVGETGVVRQWLGEGIGGWRLDVTDSLSPDLMRAIRDAAKDADPESLIIAEQWGDTTPWLLGDQADSTMNYRFRRAVIGLVNGATNDLDGSIAALTPSGFAAAMEGVAEDYPPAAFATLLNLVDSHDTTRILWTLTPGEDNEAAKSDPAARALGVKDLAILAAIQLTFPGMASIYYGDEVGLSGHDDPDDRRPYPWGTEDLSIRDHYRTLARARADHEALRAGDLTFLLADDARGTLAYLRRTDAEAAITAVNLGERERTLPIDVAGRLPDGAVLADLFDGSTVTVANGTLELPVSPRTARVLVTVPGTDLEAPASPVGLVATASTGRVELAWEPVEDADRYVVWRSPLTGGGFMEIGTTGETAFVDTTVRDGAPIHYVVTALDTAGNPSIRSAEVRAAPQLELVSVRLDAPATLDAVRSAVGPGPAVGAVVEVAEAPNGVAQGLRLELGVGPAGSDPATDPGWSWVPASLDSETGTTAAFRGTVPATTLGTQDVAARVSVDSGATWTAGDRSGSADGYAPADAAVLTVVPAADAVPPPAPAAPAALDVAEDHITIRWEAVNADDLFGYQVLRGDAGDGPLTIIATTARPVHTDTTVVAGTAYRYAVVAVDAALNASAHSPELSVAADKREVNVTFTVTVPATTPATDTIYIAGGFQDWAPGDTPMTRVDDTTWTITLPFEDATPLEYKYTRGSWEAVEKDAGCGEIANRALMTDYAADGTQAATDTVEKWRDIDGC